MFKRLIEWFKSGGTRHHPKASTEAPKPQYHESVGEPVISFIESLYRDKKRYKWYEIDQTALLKEVTESKGKLYEILDTKTGNKYQAYCEPEVVTTVTYSVSGNSVQYNYRTTLYSVIGLPFTLNYFEKYALAHAFDDLRYEARKRKARIEQSAFKRKRDEEYRQEQITRVEYAKQFQ